MISSSAVFMMRHMPVLISSGREASVMVAVASDEEEQEEREQEEEEEALLWEGWRFPHVELGRASEKKLFEFQVGGGGISYT